MTTAAPPATETREMTYLQAISDALRHEMARDPSVLCLGEDIGAFGGAFKVTDGFVEEFGPDRCLDTPLAESAIIGTAIGAAAEGMRPVCEMQFADFISCGFDQLVNVAAKLHYRQGIAVPMVVRLPSGGGFSGGPFHSQNPEAWFLQAPGLKVVAPATAADAKGLLISAIRDPNPVCYLEHKALYRHVKGKVHADERLSTGVDLAGTGSQQPQLGRVLAGADVGVEGAAAGDRVVEAREDMETGVEDLRWLPLVRADDSVAAANVAVVDACQVGGDAAAGFRPFACLLVRL